MNEIKEPPCPECGQPYLLAALKTIVEAGDCTVESIREGRVAITKAEGSPAAGSPPERDAVLDSARVQLQSALRMAERDGSDLVSVPLSVAELHAVIRALKTRDAWQR